MDLRIRNLETRFLPSISLGGQAVYQSDLPSIPISAPGFSLPSISHDQYRVGVTVDQLLYDGGLTNSQKAIERSSSDISVQEIAVATYSLRESVESAWFGILLSEAESASLTVLAEDLEARLDQARSLVDRGAATASNAEILEAEQIRIRQRIRAAESRRTAGFDVLNELTGLSLSEDTPLSLTLENGRYPGVGRRPELDLFDLSRQNLESLSALKLRSTRPRISSFVDAAVGRPQGLDFFQNEFGPFVSLGVRISWSFIDWNRSSRDRQVLALQSDGIRAREDAFMQQINATAAKIVREIEQLQDDLTADAEIIALRARISNESRSKLDNGVITATDYLVERNAEYRAQLDEQIHRIQLAASRARLVTILGAL